MIITRVMLIAMQASAAPAPPVPIAARPVCTPASDGSEIVVCGRADQEEFRLRPLSRRFEPKRTGPGLQYDLGKGAKANIYSTSQTSSDGKPDNRLLATVTIPF